MARELLGGGDVVAEVLAHLAPPGEDERVAEEAANQLRVVDESALREEEAEENYEQLAGWMSADGNDEVARFFSKMAQLERLHRDQIAKQRHALFGDALQYGRAEAADERVVLDGRDENIASLHNLTKVYGAADSAVAVTAACCWSESGGYVASSAGSGASHSSLFSLMVAMSKTGSRCRWVSPASWSDSKWFMP